jgi:hypothetical protein
METLTPAADVTELRPERGDAHARLDLFVGEWRIEGKNLDGAEEFAGTDLEGVQRCEWLPGRYFLIQRDEVHYGDGGTHQTTWITGWDVERQCYSVQFFDSLGYTRRYDVTVEGSTWTFEGETERANIVFDEGGLTYRGFWERSLAGRWVPLCEYTATRAQ